MNDLITILGPTASGKTGLAATLAAEIDGEIISADSRQVYRGMDLGTGKDLQDYSVEGKQIPYHLIDIADAGEEYNVYLFQKDFIKAYTKICMRGKKAMMCGGTGMYLESVLLNYELKEVAVNKDLRSDLEKLSDEELIQKLKTLRNVHNVTDTEDRERLIRAVEIEEGKRQKAKGKTGKEFPTFKHLVFGISVSREEIRKRITMRLKQRLDEGMLDEIRRLLDQGVTAQQLEFYGLEYKFLTQHVVGEINYNDMFQRLNTAIHQFSKRQMTWFRRMEKKGVQIHWIEGSLPMEDKLRKILNRISN